MYELTVNPEDDGKRIDNVATKNMVMLMPQSEISRAIIQKMIEEGGVLLNNSVVKPGHKVKALDRITIDMERLEKEGLLGRDRKMPKAEKIALNIIYEDDDILVVNKPSGMVVHPACGNYSGTLVNALLNYPGFLTKFNDPRPTHSVRVRGKPTSDPRLPSASPRGERREASERRIMRPGIVHRLDKDTSGIMIVAKTGPSHRKLSNQLKNRTMIKKYIAIVRGIVELDEGIINEPISHDKKNRMKMAIDKLEGKEAITFYRVVKRNREKNFTVLEVMPKTGRTHQIRIHLSHIGHPILGDILYNGPIIEGLSRQALHAKSISFIHPTKNIPMEFSAELPPDIRRFCHLA